MWVFGTWGIASLVCVLTGDEKAMLSANYPQMLGGLPFIGILLRRRNPPPPPQWTPVKNVIKNWFLKTWFEGSGI